jgi:CRP-like cAMP-binding protein
MHVNLSIHSSICLSPSGGERSSFGELGLLEGKLRSASIMADTQLQCIMIDRFAFEATIKA